MTSNASIEPVTETEEWKRGRAPLRLGKNTAINDPFHASPPNVGPQSGKLPN